jgi:hypothetical protein
VNTKTKIRVCTGIILLFSFLSCGKSVENFSGEENPRLYSDSQPVISHENQENLEVVAPGEKQQKKEKPKNGIPTKLLFLIIS